MFTNNPSLLYGATGRTGTLIAEEAVARGHRPVLAGRDPDRLRKLAERLDLPWVAGPVTEISQLLGDSRLVLLAAGPFGATAPAVLRACLERGVHYLDIANEIPVVEAALAADEEAPRRGISVLPAVGFGTVASDGLARHVADQVPEARRLEIALFGRGRGVRGPGGGGPGDRLFGRYRGVKRRGGGKPDAGVGRRWTGAARRPAGPHAARRGIASGVDADRRAHARSGTRRRPRGERVQHRHPRYHGLRPDPAAAGCRNARA